MARSVKAITAAVIATASLWPQLALAQTRATESCAELHRQYDYVNRRIAMRDAEGTADNSAPRATLRELEMMNMKQDQLILLEFMRMRSCPAPNRVGGAILYILPAMDCRLAVLRGDADKDNKCDISKWEPMSSSASSEAN